MEKILSKDEFVNKYVKEMIDNTPDELKFKGIESFYKKIVQDEMSCIESYESTKAKIISRFPLRIDWTDDDKIIVQCDDCGKVYNQE